MQGAGGLQNCITADVSIKFQKFKTIAFIGDLYLTSFERKVHEVSFCTKMVELQSFGILHMFFRYYDCPSFITTIILLNNVICFLLINYSLNTAY